VRGQRTSLNARSTKRRISLEVDVRGCGRAARAAAASDVDLATCSTVAAQDCSLLPSQARRE
jgi:hypothetical protein